ncbi:arylsulfatase B-like isoform X1 [Macrosteles quadrilineatus]|uniref:arylsulfatase B-like isoform X1 n=2 Tax=Macrosteles quadrilineatus TaxID=74068 RepID=UPI0023E26C41|nr:arylsulfatase B-like isoform X1 [Macrosteles quadrilineatus]
MFLFLSLLYFVAGSKVEDGSKPPHIVYILADDLGWNDVSFHGSDQIPTPNIDSLAYNGVILNRHYTQPLCTPSRASLMTGKYAVHTGLHDALLPTHKAGIPLTEKILPQYLKELGYSTHLVGKWHLGFYKKEFTPLQRGFDSHFGYWSGAISYYDHIDENPIPTLNYSGHDMRRGYSSACDVVGQYATDLFTREAVRVIESHEPDKPMFMFMAHLASHAGNQGKWLEAPQDEINKFSYISDPNRRTYAAMVSKLDQSVGSVITALERKGMLKNSIIVFLSDNGAPNIGVYKNWGSNYPWRGQKATLWEAAVRTPSLIWSPLIGKPSRIYNDLMHISDWLPTLLSAAGYKGKISDIDGIDQWRALSRGYPGPREEVIIDVDDKKKMVAAIYKTFKYVKGPSRGGPEDMFLNTNTIFSPRQPRYNLRTVIQSPTWQAVQKHMKTLIPIDGIYQLRHQATITCYHDFDQAMECVDQPCLFNILEDPCEQYNIADELPEATQHIERQVIDPYRKGAVVIPLIEDPESNPENFDGDWSIWVE